MRHEVQGMPITYPDLGFAFNPIGILIEKYKYTDAVILEAMMEGGNISIEREKDKSNSVFFDLSAIAKSAFDRMQFYKVESVDTTLFKNIEFRILRKAGAEELLKGSIPVLWGALQIGEIYSQSKNLTYFKGYPFTLPLYIENLAYLQYSADGKAKQDFDRPEKGRFEKGKYNLDLSKIDARYSIHIASLAARTHRLFNYTFDFTFGTHRVTYPTQVDIKIAVNDCNKEGTYLRWINKYGEYNYYLFETSNQSSTTSDHDIKFDEAFYSTYLANNYHYGASKSIGKTIEQQTKLFAHLVDSQTYDFLLHMVESPIVDLFMGYNSQKQARWMSVGIKAGTFAKSTAHLQDFECYLIPTPKQVQII